MDFEHEPAVQRLVGRVLYAAGRLQARKLFVTGSGSVPPMVELAFTNRLMGAGPCVGSWMPGGSPSLRWTRICAATWVGGNSAASGWGALPGP